MVGPVHAAGLAFNASVGGLRVAVEIGIPIGSVCTLRVRTAPDQVTLEHARVVWSKVQPDGTVMGLQFISALDA